MIIRTVLIVLYKNANIIGPIPTKFRESLSLSNAKTPLFLRKCIKALLHNSEHRV
jgi:hypothetical protein